MAASNVFSGSRARFLIANQIVGFAAGVSGSEQVEHQPIDVMDLLEVREFVPVAYRATLSAQIFRVINKSLKQQGIFPKTTAGGINNTGILTSGDLTCAIEDEITGENMAVFTGCKASEHSFDVTARGVVSENVNFVTIRMMDEFDLPSTGG